MPVAKLWNKIEKAGSKVAERHIAHWLGATHNPHLFENKAHDLLGDSLKNVVIIEG